MQYDVLEDKNHAGVFRAEAINHSDEGKCYIASFSGPNAGIRAIEYAAWQNNKPGSELVGRRSTSKISNKQLYGNFDAGAWAQQFIENVKGKKIDPADLDTVRAWFANAIMTGYDHGKPVNGDQAAHMIEEDAGLRKKL